MNDNWIPEGEAGMKQNRIEIDPAILDGISAALKKMWDEIEQAKQAKPKPAEFWEGQLVEVWSAYDNGEPRVQVRTFCRKTENGAYECYMDATRKGATHLWENCRPLQDPLILQFKPHNPGDPMPCGEMDAVKVINSAGFITQGDAYDFDWSTFRSPDYHIIGWMPADGWGRSE